jgi:saccharopine dehydrogenase (NAD+, L-lysine-forming)
MGQNADSRVVILGGYGQAGRAMVPLLLRETRGALVLAGRDGSKARRVAEEWNEHLGTGRVTWARADAVDSRSLRAAFDGADLVVVAASTVDYVRTVAEAALASGLDYLDIQYSSKKLRTLAELAPDIERAGRCFITEAGFHPGLPSALVRYAATRLDRLESAIVSSVLNQRGGLPYSGGVDELIESFRDYRPEVLREGTWQTPGFWTSYRPVAFEGGFGTRSCVPVPLEEMRALPQIVPALREAGFYIAGFNWLADWVVTPASMLALRLFRRAAVKPMGRLLCWSTRVFSRPPYGVALQLDAHGTVGQAAARLRLFLSHEDAYVFTAVPVVACLLQILDGSTRKPGLHFMGHLVDPARLLRDMQRVGIRLDAVDGPPGIGRAPA